MYFHMCMGVPAVRIACQIFCSQSFRQLELHSTVSINHYYDLLHDQRCKVIGTDPWYQPIWIPTNNDPPKFSMGTYFNLFTYIYTYIHTYIHVYTHICVCKYLYITFYPLCLIFFQILEIGIGFLTIGETKNISFLGARFYLLLPFICFGKFLNSQWSSH